MAAPFGPLKYLYVGSADFAKDLAYYRDVLGARVVWNSFAFGAHVAAFELGPGPLVLIADHRPAPSVIMIYQVDDLEATAKALKKRGWKKLEGPFGVPDGSVYTFEDPSKNRYGLLQVERPDAMLGAHYD